MQTLRRVWAQPSIDVEGARVWRPVKERPAPAERLAAPDDPDVRASTQRSVEGVGYQVHFTKTCDPATPHLIVNVETMPATTPDDHRVAVVHASLAARHRLPAEHLVDKGYTSAQVLLDSQRDDHVAIVGPVADDPRGQARAGEGFAKADFQIDGDRPVVTGPAGPTATRRRSNNTPLIYPRMQPSPGTRSTTITSTKTGSRTSACP